MIDLIKQYQENCVVFLNADVVPGVRSFESSLITGWHPTDDKKSRWLMARRNGTTTVECIDEIYIEVIQQGDKILYSK